MSENDIKPVAFDGSELRHGCVLHPKRWSGDTHGDIGGSVDEDATDTLMAAAADEIDRLKAELDAAVAERDAVRNSISNDMLKSYIEKHGDPIPLVLELASYKVDASRWNELCRQVDLTMFPYEILDDAMAMGAGALEMYIDEAMKEQEQGKK